MSKKKLAVIIAGCVIAIIVVIVLFSIKPWERTYTLSVSVSPSGAGSVSPSGGEYESGAQVTLNATPASGYTFDYWSGSVSGNTSTITITMDSDKSVTAHFGELSEVIGPLYAWIIYNSLFPAIQIANVTYLLEFQPGCEFDLPPGDKADSEILFDAGKEYLARGKITEGKQIGEQEFDYVVEVMYLKKL